MGRGPVTSASTRDGRGSLGRGRDRKAFGCVGEVPSAAPGPPVVPSTRRVTAPQGFIISDVTVTGFSDSNACFMLSRDEDPTWSPPTRQDMENGTRLPVMDYATPMFYPSSTIKRSWEDIETSQAQTVLLVNFSTYSTMKFEVFGSFTRKVDFG